VSKEEEPTRGSDAGSGLLFSYLSIDARVLRTDPLRRSRAIVNEAMAALSSESAALYAAIDGHTADHLSCTASRR